MKHGLTIGRTAWFRIGVVLWCALVLFFQLPARANESVTLAWNRGSLLNVAGYKIYYGTASRSYSNVARAGIATRLTISGLVPGRTYYFAATTVDIYGNESSFSSEASFTLPVTPATLTLAAHSGGNFSCMVTGDPGQPYVVLANSNMHDWIPVQTNTVPFVFVDTNAASCNLRLYRALYLAH